MITLFNSNGARLTKKEFKAIKTFYLNPTETMEKICELSEISYPVLYRAATKVRHRQGIMYYILFDKGYLIIPPISSLEYQPKNIIEEALLKSWAVDPFRMSQEIANEVSYSKATVELNAVNLYKNFGYNDMKPKKAWTMRMRFFKFMGWLDVERLKSDVYKYLEATDESL